MVGSDATVDIDRSSTPFPRSRRSEWVHERVSDFNKRNRSPVPRSPNVSRPRRWSPSPTRKRRYTSPTRPRRLSPSPPRYRPPPRVTSSTSRWNRTPSPYFKQTRITETRTTYRSPSPIGRYGSYSSGPRSEYVTPRTPPRAPRGSSPARYRTSSPRVVDFRPPETSSAFHTQTSRYDSYPSGPISEYVPARRTPARAKSPARGRALSPRIIEPSYKDYGSARNYSSRF
ncbi:hypothetical protein B0T21DRAFT_414024 [Apiosordaria backusii]|uniref:Uncharacterized protein n=1 Tax=Apiosordaria backusii TaxID=314023 RepID=A0AA40AX67_9PEZI|nr:hypothetical protein B0T21DRAFT_414024 [Apiosordaria backusii]